MAKLRYRLASTEEMKEIGPVYDITLDGTNTLHMVNGNDKLGKGIYTFNLLPGGERAPWNTKNGAPLWSGSLGTCRGYCEDCDCQSGCYAVSDAALHHNVCVKAWGDNTLLARFELEYLFEQIEFFVANNLVSVIRVHAAGEFFGLPYMQAWAKFSARHPEIKIYCYTKAFDLLEACADMIPDNMIVNVSIWHDNYTNPLGFPEFIYDDHTDDSITNLPHCPAVDKNGHATGITCSRCRHCFNAKHGDRWAVYAH